jgi:hypothetical protein
LRHTSSPFCFGYFGDGGLLNYLPGLAWNLHPPDLSLPGSWRERPARAPAQSMVFRTSVEQVPGVPKFSLVLTNGEGR